jgi:hypothetical protein
MYKLYLALVAGVAIAIAASPANAVSSSQSCSPGGASGAIQLMDNGSEAVESFSCGSEYEFTFTNSPGTNTYLNMAFGGSPAYEYSVEGKAVGGGYDETNYYYGGTSTSVGYGPGTWDVYVSLIDVPVAEDPFSGFDLTDSVSTIEIPSGTPLPSTWTMLLIGFVGLGFFSYRGMKNRSTSLAAA